MAIYMKVHRKTLLQRLSFFVEAYYPLWQLFKIKLTEKKPSISPISGVVFKYPFSSTSFRAKGESPTGFFSIIKFGWFLIKAWMFFFN